MPGPSFSSLLQMLSSGAVPGIGSNPASPNNPGIGRGMPRTPGIPGPGGTPTSPVVGGYVPGLARPGGIFGGRGRFGGEGDFGFGLGLGSGRGVMGPNANPLDPAYGMTSISDLLQSWNER